ncbi:unnamed protein product [Soboliphyme baturini]|uniref:PWI domain-containing protein n=1 Tax=Soboliphyme baturini TaxID=241478 RepID=A0A183J0J5_9BILA|nr:unnamed protein product [Soboliphyme baturini]
MQNLEFWVSEKLHDVIGLSDRHVAEFMVALVKKCNSADSFLSRLKETVPVNDRVSEFARELWSKVPRESTHPTTSNTAAENRLKEKRALEFQQWNSSFQLLPDQQSDEEKRSRSPVHKKKHLRMRHKVNSSSDDEKEVARDTSSKAKKKLKVKVEEEDELEKFEKERLVDLEERDALAQRLKKKDKEKTRHIVEKSDRKVNEWLLR